MAQTSTRLEQSLANPAPVGLLGFALTTILLNFANAGFYPLGSTVLAMGLFTGGVAQYIAGIMEFRRGNTFGTTAFLLYGSFWVTLVFVFVLPRLGWAAAYTNGSMAVFFFFWGLFSLFMFAGTLRLNGALMAVFGTLFILFFLLSAGFATNNANIIKLAGYEGILCGLCAFYTAMAEILNEVNAKSILPVFPVKTKA